MVGWDCRDKLKLDRTKITYAAIVLNLLTTLYTQGIIIRVLGSLSTYARQKPKFFLDSVCVSHVTNMIEGKIYHVTAREPDQNKSTKRERESTTRKPWASLAVAASIGYAPPTCVLAQ